MPGPSGHSRRRARGARQHSAPGSRVTSSNGGDGGGTTTPSTAATTGLDSGDEPTRLSATDLYQRAQDASSELKALLSQQPPWSREAEPVRQRARNAFMTLIFQHPLSPHAQSIDTLWFNTTYSLISEYREVVARIEAALPAVSSTGAGGKQQRSGDPKFNKHMGGGDVVADHRRTLSRFRSLLVNEDAFYRAIATRITGFYRLQERAGQYLSIVGIPVPAAGAEEDPSLAPPLSREESEKKVAMVYKALVYLGDLERYKEQYSDKARREAREGAAPVARADSSSSERYQRAIMFYEVARGLQPDNGQSFNQLAVVDGYIGDNFHCTYHYFRALAVLQPFPSGRANLERVLKKAFDRWRAKRHAEEAGVEQSGPKSPTDDPEAFKRDLLIILAIHFVRAGTSHLRQLRPPILELFSRLLLARQLPSETIVKTTAMVIGSHWQTRFDQLNTAQEADPAEAAKQSGRRRAVEQLALGFLLNIFTVLITVSANEVDEVLAAEAARDESALATDDGPGNDSERDGTLALAQRITAVVRRILPSLRIMSRWIKSHLEYIARASSGSNVELAETITTFWTEYKRLMLSLARLFPLVQLPGLDEPLEEDLDMRGFLPLKRGHAVSGPGNVDEFASSSARQEVHPNEEQLMRISDLLVDVKLLMQTESGSAALSSGVPLPSAPFIAQPAGTDTMSVSVSTETEDDPVNLAMRATLTEGSITGDEPDDFDDDEEVIVWGRRTPIGAGAAQKASPIDAHGPTAHEMLQTLTLQQPPSTGAAVPPSPLAPGLLFGGDLSGSGSIWTMSREESHKGVHRAAHHPTSAPPAPYIANPWQYDGPKEQRGPSPQQQHQHQQQSQQPQHPQPPQQPPHQAHAAFASNYHPMSAWPPPPHQQQPHQQLHQHQQPHQQQRPMPPHQGPPGLPPPGWRPPPPPVHQHQPNQHQHPIPQPYSQHNIWGAPDSMPAHGAYPARPGPAMWSYPGT